MTRIGQISVPWRGLRNHDPCGDGNFGASRGNRPHKGVDYAALPGDICIAPFDALVTRIGIAYTDSSLGSIHLQGINEYWPYSAKILYTDPEVAVGIVVKRGQRIGIVQNVAAYHKAEGKMRNHLHMELTVLADSQLYLEEPHL